MNTEKISLTKDDRKYHFYNCSIISQIPLSVSSGNREFRILFLSRDFWEFSSNEVEANIEKIVAQKGLTEISFFWPSATLMEKIADNKIVNLWTEDESSWALSIITTSEDNLQETGFLYAFTAGWLSGSENNEYVKENFIMYDDTELYEAFSKLI